MFLLDDLFEMDPRSYLNIYDVPDKWSVTAGTVHAPWFYYYVPF